jgi:hypothetical protein
MYLLYAWKICDGTSDTEQANLKEKESCVFNEISGYGDIGFHVLVKVESSNFPMTT